MTTRERFYLMAITALIILIVLLLAHLHSATRIVGYTQPQHEVYADGTDDWISYPIYASQEAR